MKFTKTEAKLIGLVSKQRSSIPVLNCALIQNKMLRVTDCKLDFVMSAPDLGDEFAAVRINPLLTSLHQGAWSFQPDAGKINGKKFASSLGYYAEVTEITAENAPDLIWNEAAEKEHLTFKLPCSEFLRAYLAVSPAISNEETRYYLNGVYYDGENFAATDGHRLSQYHCPVDVGGENKATGIIPKRSLKLLATLAAALPRGIFTVKWCESRVSFKVGKYTVSTKLIDGKFPDYKRVIPQNTDKAMRVRLADFVEVISRISSVGGYKETGTFGRALKLTQNGEKLKITYDNVTGFGYEGAVDILEGGMQETGFNHRYVKQALEMFKGCDEIVIRSTESAAPITLESEDFPGFLTVLMPMRV